MEKILRTFYLKCCNDQDGKKDGKRNPDDDPIKILIGNGNENTEDWNDKETSDDVNHSKPLIDGHLLS